MKVNGGYDWFRYMVTKEDGHQLTEYKEEQVYPIISNNRRNQNPVVYHCEKCHSMDRLTGSYISFVDEETFWQILIHIWIMLLPRVRTMLQVTT